ncbi:MAG: hypothetical protein GC155_16110 [Alphaproteobacteria bacterium]|nr:hypothetical protein [Alphaproteobacteria bacterium]
MIVGMFVLSGIVISNFVEWNNAADALRTVSLITLPVEVLGAALVLIGRWTYGGWKRRAPLRWVSAQIFLTIGVLTVAALGVMLLLLIIAGVGPQDRSDAASLGLGVLAGLAIVLVGVLIRPRIERRAYKKT